MLDSLTLEGGFRVVLHTQHLLVVVLCEIVSAQYCVEIHISVVWQSGRRLGLDGFLFVAGFLGVAFIAGA